MSRSVTRVISAVWSQLDPIDALSLEAKILLLDEI